MEVSSSTSSSYYPFYFSSSLFSASPCSFALIPLEIGFPWGTHTGTPLDLIYNVQNDAAVLGDRLPEVNQKPFLGPGSFFLQCWHRERARSACRVSILLRCCHSTHSLLFRGSPGVASAAVRDPNPPRPSARSRVKKVPKSLGVHKILFRKIWFTPPQKGPK